MPESPCGPGLMAAVFGGATSEASLAALKASNACIEQLMQADLLVAAVPMHDFGVPSGPRGATGEAAKALASFAAAA